MKFTSSAGSTGTEAPSPFMISCPSSLPYDLEYLFVRCQSLALYSLLFFLRSRDLMVTKGKTSAVRQNANHDSLVPPANMQQDNHQSIVAPPKHYHSAGQHDTASHSEYTSVPTLYTAKMGTILTPLAMPRRIE
ncbi:hypothetical protein FPHYL_877 [Fusarium phyllophilum]|uniref:Uncharacterized protein n=1 Tax=Fusarium phyllophilum TaxID=47803 RepID=A0A8H5KFD7_9HYPO|nr:hypothetical protein FPHYL_877 [Fusarium phyllophilum]